MFTLPLALDSTTELPHAPPPVLIPRLGFGLYLSPPEVTSASVLEAIKHGYRHFDSAQYYENEAQLGEAIRKSGIDRKNFFITTKILVHGGSVEKSLQSCWESVRKIGCGGYVDLFLVHSPSGGKEARKQMWKALEMLLKVGGTRAIGVSNYGVKHLEEMKEYADCLPSVNQVELHPWCQQRPITQYCEQENIIIEAYCPIARGKYFNHPMVQTLAANHKATPSQILIRWSLQHGFIPLPKSDNPQRIRENAGVYHFQLTAEEVKMLDGLDQGKSGALVPQYTECV